MNLPLLILLVLWGLVNGQDSLAELKNVTFSLGGKRTLILYQTDLLNPRYLKVREDSDTIYVVAVPADSNPTANTVLCKSSIATEVIIGPRGCDNSVDPSLSVEASNCAAEDREAAEKKTILENSFWLTSGTSACLANGGDVFSCLGPIWLVRPNSMLPLNNLELTSSDFLMSQGVALITGFGPRCEAPLITWLDVVMPMFEIASTDCVDDRGNTYVGQYEPEFHDYVMPEMKDEFDTTNETQIFSRVSTGTHQRLALQLYDGTPGLYRVLLYSVGTTERLHVSYEIVTRDWLTNATLLFTFTSGCSASLTIEQGPPTMQLRPPEQLNDLNFYKNQHPQHFYVSRECNYVTGKLDSNRRLKYAFIDEGHRSGGEAVWKTPGLLGKPLQIDPDPTFEDYEIDNCDNFNPMAISFQPYNLGGGDDVPLAEPYIPDLGLCFAPFLEPLYISDRGGNADAKHMDCFKLGGDLYGTGQDRCVRPIQRTLCKKGMMYYHQHCYYKFDAERESRFKTVDAFADDVCRQVHPKARALTRITRGIRAFLQRFVFWKRQPGHPYRYKVGGKQCEAVDIVVNSTSVDQGYVDDYSVVYDINCDTIAAFPVCVYHVKDVPIPHAELSLTVNTIRVMKYGQKGLPHVGREVDCKCYPGYTGRGCSAWSCPVPPLGSNDTLSKFFAKCYSNRRGSCQDRNPRFCSCFEGYGPAANWISDHRDHPCACPGVPANEDPSSAIVQGYVIDGTFHSITPEDNIAVCGGSDRGSCTVDAALNYGLCQCQTRVNMDPDAKQKLELAWDSTHCTAAVPMTAANQFVGNGDIVERFCNCHGTACPSGERCEFQRLDEFYFSIVGRDVCRTSKGALRIGCVCDNGWSGIACTCPVPKNILETRMFPLYDEGNDGVGASRAYILLETRSSVAKVKNLDVNVCNITQISIQDTPSSPYVECTASATGDRDIVSEWTCPPNTPATRVVVQSADPNVLFCTVQAFKEDHPPCGNHPLVWAGAFFRNEQYRSYFKYELMQSSLYAPHGCTITECMCGPEYTGPLCNFGVSAFRYDPDQLGYHKEVCGSNMFPRRGYPGPAEKGCLCNQLHGVVSEARFKGDACEGVEVRMPNGTWLDCYGRGEIIPASYPTGTCEFDLQDLNSDPLRTPYFGINPSVNNPDFYLYLVEPFTRQGFNETHGSLILVDEDEFWEIPPGTTIYVPNLVPINQSEPVLTYDVKVPIPVNISYFCSADAPTSPYQALVYGEYWRMEFICETETPESLVDGTCYTTIKSEWLMSAAHFVEDTKIRCPYHWGDQIVYSEANEFDWDYECFAGVVRWEPDPESEKALVTEFYAHTLMIHGQLRKTEDITYTERSFAYGQYDCSDPIDRVLSDTAYALGLGSTRQCDGLSIRDHSDVNGAWYGLFEGFIAGLTFPAFRSWSEEEWGFISSLLNGKVCVSTENALEFIHDAFDTRVLDSISKSWLNDVPPETDQTYAVALDTGAELTTYRVTNVSLWQEYVQAQFGGGFIHEHYLLYGTLLKDALETLPGYVTVIPLPRSTFIRKLIIRLPFDGVDALRVFGPTGYPCATYLSFEDGMTNGTELEVECIDPDNANQFLPEPEQVTLDRMATLLGGNQTKLNETIEAYCGQGPSILLQWSHREFPYWNNGTFNASDIRILSRNVTYTGLFQGLKESILLNKTFPSHTVYETSCLRKTGRILRDLNTSHPDDQDYLRKLHLTHLARRRCSDTLQCKKFARNQTAYECVFDQVDYAESWSGASVINPTPSFLGNEGGCRCNVGFSDPMFHCTTCRHGYGPSNEFEWAKFREFNDILNLTTPTLEDSLCQLPWDPTSLRENKVCGGRGDIVMEETTTQANLTVFLATNETRRCPSVEMVGVGRFSLVEELDHDLHFMRYYQPDTERWLTVFEHDEIYLDHEQRMYPLEVSVDRSRLLLMGNVTLICNSVLFHETHYVEFGSQFRRMLDSSLSFFLARVDFTS